MYRVLIPVDGNEERAEQQVRTLENLPETVEDIEAHVLYIYEEIDAPGDEGGHAYIEEINAELDELRDRPETVDWVEDALSDWSESVTVHEQVGNPAKTILGLADELGIDLIVMGVRERSPVGKVVFGSVSQKVILGSDVPVIIAR